MGCWHCGKPGGAKCKCLEVIKGKKITPPIILDCETHGKHYIISCGKCMKDVKKIVKQQADLIFEQNIEIGNLKKVVDQSK